MPNRSDTITKLRIAFRQMTDTRDRVAAAMRELVALDALEPITDAEFVGANEGLTMVDLRAAMAVAGAMDEVLNTGNNAGKLYKVAS